MISGADRGFSEVRRYGRHALGGVLLATACDEFLQVLAGIHNVTPQSIARDLGIARPASVYQLAVRIARQMQIAREHEMESRVAIAIMIQRFDETHHHRAVRGAVKRRVKQPVPVAPGLRLRFVFKRLLELTQDFLSAPEILLLQVRNCLAQHVAFEDGSRLEQFADFFGRERGHDGASVGDDFDQPFGREVTQRLAYRYAADLKFSGNYVLAELLPFAQLAAQDLLAQSLDNSR